MLKKIDVQIKGIHCNSCKTLIESELKLLNGVQYVAVNVKTGGGRIKFDESIVSPREISETIKKLNYGVQIIEENTKRSSGLKYKKIVVISLLIFMLVVGYITIIALNSARTTSAEVSGKAGINRKAKNRPADNNDGFLGERGDETEAQTGKIYISEAKVNDGNMHAFNYYSAKAGKNIHFFVVKAPDGTYRTAANACEVCFGARKGFKQIGDLIRCENCRVTYEKSKIALEKGGCNPGPIDNNTPVAEGKLVIDAKDVEAVAYLF